VSDGWGDGVRLLTGARPTAVEGAELERAVRLLRDAAAALGTADALLAAASDEWGAALHPAAGGLGAAAVARRAELGEARRRAGLASVARRGHELARKVRVVLGWYDDAEARVGGAPGALADVMRRGPFAPFALATVDRALRLAVRDRPPAPAEAERVRLPDGCDPGLLLSLTADGRGEAAVGGLASGLLRLGSPLGALVRDPVALVAGGAARLLHTRVDPVVVPVVDPPELPAPRTVADTLDVVERSYGERAADGSWATPGVVTLQELTHPDGTRAWVVAIPGTQQWSPNADTPTDLTTNLRLLGGLDDDMTDAVVDALGQAGVQEDEPVMLVGHSQGGMVAESLATALAGSLAVRAVVTAGSPDLTAPTPADVPVRRYRRSNDLVPQLDGARRPLGPRESVVEVLGPEADTCTPSFADTHSIAGYAAAARRADVALAGSRVMSDFDAAAREVLGPAGTTARTLQFRAHRSAPVGAAPP